MSVQDMSLETAIQLFDLVINFDEYEEGLREVLTRVHAQEELDMAKEIIDKKKQHLMETNPEFKTVINQRKTSAKMQSDYDRAIYKAQLAESRSKTAMDRAEARAQVRSALSDEDIGEWVAKTRIRTRTFDEAQKQRKEGLWCPICRERDDNRNTINGKPACMKDRHFLVPKSELKKYNREYRRTWKRKRN